MAAPFANSFRCGKFVGKMDQTIFDTAYPTLCRLLKGTKFDQDKEAAAAMMPDEFKEALRGSRFRLNALMDLLRQMMVPSWKEMAGDELEANLKRIADAVGPDQVRRVYRDKLLVAEAGKLEDVRYEIAVTARACAVLDPSTVQLERPIPGTETATSAPKNSDVYGLFKGQPVRIEITVLHEPRSEPIPLEIVQIIRDAPSALKFSVKMRFAALDEDRAKQVRAVLERLCEHHLSSGGVDTEIAGWKFVWSAGTYRCLGATSLVESAWFHDEEDFCREGVVNEVRFPPTVENLTPEYLREEAPRYRGVVSLVDVLDAPKKHPVSTKVYRMIDGKLAQCEEDAINIVAFGNPLPQHEGAVKAALHGVVSVEIPAVELPPDPDEPEGLDPRAILLLDQARPTRAPKAPFNPASRLANPEDREQFMGSFRRLSAVWHVRLGSGGISEMHRNANASHPVPPELARGLCSSDLFAAFAPATGTQRRAGAAETVPASLSQRPD